ncbi:MAG: hypothetical protein IT423_04100 [Pirellulaceae bacterium]|nr:hypothetical protein [Pirellulaceae bacterium]
MLNQDSETQHNTHLDGSSIAAIMTVLDIVSEQLNDIARDVEISVMGVCSGFQGMSSRARTALAKAADALDTSSDDGGLPAFVHRVRMSLATMLARLESSRDFSLHLTEQIDEIDERLSLVVKLGEKMIQISSDARNATNQSMAIVKRSIGNRGDAEKMLDSFAVMAQASAQCGQAICSLVMGLRSITKDGASRARSKAEEDQKTIATSENTIRSTLDMMSTSYEKMNESLSSSAAMNRQLNLDIGQAVMSMQFQDRVNQRIEHIVSTIHELNADLRPMTLSSDPNTAQLITKLWTDRLAEKSTMSQERTGGSSAPAESSADSSIDLF